MPAALEANNSAFLFPDDPLCLCDVARCPAEIVIVGGHARHNLLEMPKFGLKVRLRLLGCA